MIAAIYCRRSNEQNDRDEADKSVKHQEERGREYIARKGWTLAEDHIYNKDDGISGEEFAKRPDLMIWLNRYAKLVAASTVLLIAAGGMVTSTGSGLSVPDWPNTYGWFMPQSVARIPPVGRTRIEPP